MDTSHDHPPTPKESIDEPEAIRLLKKHGVTVTPERLLAFIFPLTIIAIIRGDLYDNTMLFIRLTEKGMLKWVFGSFLLWGSAALTIVLLLLWCLL